MAHFPRAFPCASHLAPSTRRPLLLACTPLTLNDPSTAVALAQHTVQCNLCHTRVDHTAMTSIVTGHAAEAPSSSAEEYAPSKSLLSDKAILAHMQLGSVLIEPFMLSNLSTSSYDVTLGRFFFRESEPEPGLGIYNPVRARRRTQPAQTCTIDIWLQSLLRSMHPVAHSHSRYPARSHSVLPLV
jgi:hypothetical protein